VRRSPPAHRSSRMPPPQPAGCGAACWTLSWRCRWSRSPPGRLPGCQVLRCAAVSASRRSVMARPCCGWALLSVMYAVPLKGIPAQHAGAAARQPAGPRTVASRPAQVLAAALLVLCMHLATRQLRQLSAPCTTLPGMLTCKHHLLTALRRSSASHCRWCRLCGIGMSSCVLL
jgi:hypothetical protein